VSGTSVSLTWTPETSWGTGCPANTNTYKVYIDTNASPTNNVATLSSTTLNHLFTGIAGRTYYWKIVADNGSHQATSVIRSFTFANLPWWQAAGAGVTAANGNI
jgi:hypothetical protein